MYIKKIKINNFRGIKEANINFDNKLICLIGNSDSTKTTILDAIEYALYPYWNINITNTDFYQCNIDSSIIIQITIGDLPEYFLNEETFGLYIRKYIESDENDEPNDDDEIFLTIQLTINNLFEPEWKVITNRNIEKLINYKDRSKLSTARVGENIDKDFYVGRNSILKSYINDTDDLDQQLFGLLQSLKQHDIDSTSIKPALESIKSVINSYNLKLENDLSLELEIKSSDLNISNIGISDGLIPLNKKGTGTKRLLSTMLNLEGKKDNSSILIDEIEYGLEPYRIADLLYKLKDKKRQSIVTTHSTIPITELDYNNIFVCRSDNGITKCKQVPSEFQNILRRYPYAFLSRKVLITEGATEWGILHYFNKLWSDKCFSFAYSSGIVMDGNGGTSAISYAKKFYELGYNVAIFIDSDDPITNVQAEKLTDIKVFKLEKGYNTEKTILKDIDLNNLNLIIDIMVEKKSEQYVKQCINEEFDIDTIDLNELKEKFTEEQIKNKIYNILIKKDKAGKDVFKSIRYGESLGKLIYDLSLTKLKESDYTKLLEEVRVWCNGK